jgi:hypothetical protein
MSRLRRFSLFVCFACFVGTSCLTAADATFVRLWPGWRDTDSFDRIAEFLGGSEPASRRTLLRTQPASRAGYYFLFRVNTPATTPGAKFQLSVIRPDSPTAQTFTFPANTKAGDTVFDLGLTGTDWPDGKKANPVAWKLSFVAADGRVLAEHKSFLWEKPAAPVDTTRSSR